MSEFKPRILVADDDPRAAASVKALVELYGYDASVVSDGRQAIEALTGQHHDVLLLDLMMPRMGGVEVMDHLRNSDLDVTVIVVSGDTSVDQAIQSLRCGAHDFVRKPYAPEVLMQTVENALRKRHLEQENRQVHEKLRHSERLYRYMVNSSPDIIYILDEEGLFTFVNERITSLLGYAPAELIGRHYSNLVYPEDLDKARYAFNERRTGERATRNVEMRLRCKDSASSPRHFDTNTLPIEISSMGMYVVDSNEGDRRYLGTYGVARDITERKRAEEVIRYQAFHDLLTGLPNRALFKDRLKLSISQARRQEQSLAVMFLDLDRFKLVNDTLGHVRGDELLQQVATRLRACLREGDTIARVGGDEFLVLIPRIDSPEDAAETATKLIQVLQQPFVLEDNEVFVSTSIGITRYPEHGEDMDALIKNADIAMYHIKEKGRDGFEFYDEDMQVRFSHYLSLETGIRRAVERDEFQLFYQPQVDISNDTVVGVEALIRWNHPERGLLAPIEFVPHAEECGLITVIGEWVLENALGQLRDWRAQGLKDLRLAVNLSALQLVGSQSGRIVELLEAYDIPGNRLEFEITENVIMKDIDSAVNCLNLLTKHGIQIAVDDFGTGYSSLAYLQKLPIHTIKIDRSFVWDIRNPDSKATIVNAVVALAEGLGLKVVAEGVETREQVDYLKRLGCEVMQGFLLGKPMSAEDLAELVLDGGPAPAPVAGARHQA